MSPEIIGVIADAAGKIVGSISGCLSSIFVQKEKTKASIAWANQSGNWVFALVVGCVTIKLFLNHKG